MLLRHTLGLLIENSGKVLLERIFYYTLNLSKEHIICYPPVDKYKAYHRVHCKYRESNCGLFPQLVHQHVELIHRAQ